MDYFIGFLLVLIRERFQYRVGTGHHDIDFITHFRFQLVSLDIAGITYLASDGGWNCSTASIVSVFTIHSCATNR